MEHQNSEKTLSDVFATLSKRQRWAIDILVQIKTNTCKASVKELKKAKDIITNTLNDDQILALKFYLDELEKQMLTKKEEKESGGSQSE